MPTKIVIKKNTYFDSVSLMSVWEVVQQGTLIARQGICFRLGILALVQNEVIQLLSQIRQMEIVLI